MNDEFFVKQVEDLGSVVASVLLNGGTILLAGNGGSAADAQHISAEFVSRFAFDRPGLAAIALTTDTSALTAIGNDYGYEQVFARQVQAVGRSEDLFIGISTSGTSKNILNALQTASERSIKTCFLTGEYKRGYSCIDYEINVPSSNTARIQECHITIGHAICGIAEKLIFPKLAQD